MTELPRRSLGFGDNLVERERAGEPAGREVVVPVSVARAGHRMRVDLVRVGRRTGRASRPAQAVIEAGSVPKRRAGGAARLVVFVSRVDEDELRVAGQRLLDVVDPLRLSRLIAVRYRGALAGAGVAERRYRAHVGET